MQTPVVSGYRWKTRDLERLPEEPFLSSEIIDGELIGSRKAHLRYAAIIGKLCAQIYPAVRASSGLLLVEPGIVWSYELGSLHRMAVGLQLPGISHPVARGRGGLGVAHRPSSTGQDSPTRLL
jgi:hypothetical protein